MSVCLPAVRQQSNLGCGGSAGDVQGKKDSGAVPAAGTAVPHQLRLPLAVPPLGCPHQERWAQFGAAYGPGIGKALLQRGCCMLIPLL